MHILIVSHNYPTPLDQSYGFFCKDQAEALVSQGAKVGVVGPLLISMNKFKGWKFNEFGLKKFKSSKGVLTELLVMPSIPKIPKARAWLVYQTGRCMIDSYVKQHGKPDLIHLQVYLGGDVAIYASRKYNIPLVWTEHFSNVAKGIYFPIDKEMIKKVVYHANFRIGVSKFFCMALEKQFGVPFHFVPNVFNDSIFHLSQFKREKNFTFINVGYFNPIKKHTRLVRAFASIASTLPISLKLIGSGDCLDEVKQLVNELGLANVVFFKGELTAEEIAEELRSSHVCVLSSDLETFNVSIVEAMACGLPVVSTRCGGPETIIDHAELGLLTERDDLSLAEGMRSVINNYESYNPIHISQYVFHNYSSAAVGLQLHKLMETVINNFSRKSN